MAYRIQKPRCWVLRWYDPQNDGEDYLTRHNVKCGHRAWGSKQAAREFKSPAAARRYLQGRIDKGWSVAMYWRIVRRGPVARKGKVKRFIDSIESDDAHYSVPMHLALMDAEDALTSPAPLQVGGRRLVPECVHGLPISRDCAECDAGSGTKYASAVEERNVAERLWSDAEARLEALRPMYESAIAARRAWTPTRESNDRIERTASYLVDEVGKALTSTAPPAGVAAGDEPRLTCSECNTTWSAANTKPGDLCGVRISGSYWCDGKLAAPTAAGDGGE